MKITLVDDVKTTTVEHVELDWAEIKEWLKTPLVQETRAKAPLFVGGEFKKIEDGARVQEFGGYSRSDENLLGLYLLVLDVDNDPKAIADGRRSFGKLQDVLKSLDGLEFAYYTSFNHQNPEKHLTDKFRVLLPLKDIVSKNDIKARLEILAELFPWADRAGFTFSQPFYVPIKHPDREYLFGFGSGEAFDLLAIAPAKREVFAPRPAKVIGFFDDLPVIRTVKFGAQKANVLFDLMAEGYENRLQCYKIDEPDSKPGCFILKRDTGLYFHSPAGGRFIRVLKTEALELEFQAKEIVESDADAKKVLETVVPMTRTFDSASSWSARRSLIRQFLSVKSRTKVIRTPEGFGKSTMIVQELPDRILFCCASNAQVSAKMRDFSDLNPHRIYSVGALVEERLGVRPVYKQSSGFEQADLDVEETLSVITEKTGLSASEAGEVLEELRDEARRSRQSEARLVITTFAMGDHLVRTAGHLGRTIIVDDPSASDLLTKKVNLAEDGFCVTAERKHDDVIFASAVFDRVIWTTTEKLVTELIRAIDPKTYVHEVTQNLKTERLLLYGTRLCHKIMKPILVGIGKAVRKDDDFNIIANGVDAELNLVSTKGRNDLNSDTLIVISAPHPAEVASIAASLGLSYNDARVQSQLVIDVTDQAIGRTQGYRDAGAETLVLCSPALRVLLKARSRYQLPEVEGFQRRGKLHGCPLVWHVHFPQWWSAIIGYIETWQQHTQVIGTRVYSALTLEPIGMSSDDLRLLKSKLAKPASAVGKRWVPLTEVVEGEGRRNYTVELSELVSQINRDLEPKSRMASGGRAGGKKKKPRPVTCVNSSGSELKLMPGDVVPLGFELKKKNGAYVIDGLRRLVRG